MFEVGFVEILLISALALIVLGPEKLPHLARQVGRWVGRARAMARQFREQLEQETTLDEDLMSSKPAQRRPPRPSDSASATGISTTGIAANSQGAGAALTAPGADASEPHVADTLAAVTPAPPDEDDGSAWYPPDHHAHPEYRTADAVANTEPEQQSLFEGAVTTATAETPDPNQFGVNR